MYSVLGARFGAGVGCSTLLVGGSREPSEEVVNPSFDLMNDVTFLC